MAHDKVFTVHGPEELLIISLVVCMLRLGDGTKLLPDVFAFF